MKHLLKLEEAAQFFVGIALFHWVPYAWWWFWVLLLVPDISMLGYLINHRFGAYLYNIVHHKALAIGIGGLSFYLGSDMLFATSIILYSHSAMDRVFGYGLKYTTGFKHTHLGQL